MQSNWRWKRRWRDGLNFGPNAGCGASRGIREGRDEVDVGVGAGHGVARDTERGEMDYISILMWFVGR